MSGLGFPIFRLMLATAGGWLLLSARLVPAQTAGDRPAATRPADAPGEEGLGDFEELWQDPKQPSVLTTAAEVRALSPEQAAAGRPVRVRGTVTFLSMAPPLMFVQDNTGGVCVSGTRDRELRAQLRYGATVQIEGITAAAGDVAIVTSPGRDPVKIDFVSEGRAPFPRSATIAQLVTPALHGEQVEVEGVVRSVRVEPLGVSGLSAAVLTLAQGPHRVEAVMFGRSADALAAGPWVGAVVRARGVFNAAALERQDLTLMRLLLRAPRDLVVRAPARSAAELPLTPIRAIEAATTTRPSPPTRTRVAGVVTLALPGKGMFVQDESGGVWVEGPAAARARAGEQKEEPALAPGDVVHVVGFAGRRRWSGVLTDATWTVTGKAALPDAPLLTPERALAAGMDARLVRIEAMVLSVSRLSEHTTLVLQSESRVFLARLADPSLGPPPSVREGSWVRVSGVCVQSPLADEWGAAPATGSGVADTGAPPPAGSDARPPSFHMLVPSHDAVRLIRGPGWWTPQRLLVVFGLLAAVALVAVSWVVALRRRVTRQTRLIRDHVAKRALYEERVRIARDLHDSLEQDLLGITMQLNATEKLLEQPERARQSLQLAAAMVRRSQAETHRAVWDLRERRPGQDGLVAAIREAVAGLGVPQLGGSDGNGAAGAVTVDVVGEPRELPPQVENHLHRVALEAVTNAVKHAGATRIDVELTFVTGSVRLRVSDDGRGFDADRLPPPSSGHFGLFGMRERAEKLGAALTIRSRPGGGTEVRLDVPLGAAGGTTRDTPGAAEAVPQ